MNMTHIDQTKKYVDIQCDAIRWEQFLRRCHLDSFNKETRNEDNNLDQIFISKYVRIIFMVI